MELTVKDEGLLDNSTNKADAPLKTYINFAEVKSEKKTNWALLIPGLILIVVCAALITKFGVIDRFRAADEAQAEVEALRGKIAADEVVINSANELAEEFYHATWSDMTDEEKDRIRRIDAAELIKNIASAEIKVNSYNVKGNLITVDITTDSLSNVSKLSDAISAETKVESVSVANAQKTTKDDQTTTTYAADGTPIESKSSSKIVTAQIKIYMKTLSVLAAEREAVLSSTNG